MGNTNEDQSSPHQEIVPGIAISLCGQATVAPSMADVLFDLALELEELTTLPADVEHVLAAIVLAARNGDLDPKQTLSARDPELAKLLAVHVTKVFDEFDGKVGRED